jgi:hypothetical protein
MDTSSNEQGNDTVAPRNNNNVTKDGNGIAQENDRSLAPNSSSRTGQHGAESECQENDADALRDGRDISF